MSQPSIATIGIFFKYFVLFLIKNSSEKRVENNGHWSTINRQRSQCLMKHFILFLILLSHRAKSILKLGNILNYYFKEFTSAYSKSSHKVWTYFFQTKNIRSQFIFSASFSQDRRFRIETESQSDEMQIFKRLWDLISLMPN